MYRLIAMDFDGTLLTDNKTLLQETKYKLLKCRENGIFIVGVTARCLKSALDVVPACLFDYLILNNGSYQYSVDEDKGKYLGIISKDEAQQIIDLCQDRSFQIDLVSGEKYYIYKNKKNSDLDFIVDIESVSDIEEDIARMNIFLENQEDVSYMFNLICSKYPNLNTAIMQDSDSIKKWLIINPLGIDKSMTLEKLGKDLGVGLNEMIFFGDGLNDLEVMKKVGCSVAMGNALDVIRDSANFVTDSNNCNGISKFLDKHLIKR